MSLKSEHSSDIKFYVIPSYGYTQYCTLPMHANKENCGYSNIILIL